MKAHRRAVREVVEASPPGHGPGLHRHPYAEVFVLHQGSGSFLAGDETIEASGRSVVVVPAEG
jgi:mannose-6-phosphate isomerase-like protein (cupin superfamily)